MNAYTNAAPLPPGRARPELMACDHCDALYRRPVLKPGEQARCQRCRKVLARGHRLSDSALLALAVTAFVVLWIANAQPIVDLSLRGLHNSATLPGAILDTWADGESLVAPMIALIAAAAGLAFPTAAVSLRLYALLPVAFRRLPPHWAQAVRLLHAVERWSMVDVLLLAALVSIVRIAGLAQVVPGAGLIAFLVLALLLAAQQAAGQDRLWRLGEAFSGTPA